MYIMLYITCHLSYRPVRVVGATPLTDEASHTFLERQWTALRARGIAFSIREGALGRMCVKQMKQRGMAEEDLGEADGRKRTTKEPFSLISQSVQSIQSISMYGFFSPGKWLEVKGISSEWRGFCGAAAQSGELLEMANNHRPDSDHERLGRKQ